MSLQDEFLAKGLTNKESEVACLVADGLSNREAAHRQFISEKTIKFHLTHVFKKMGFKSRAQLIVWSIPYQSKKVIIEEIDDEPPETLDPPYILPIGRK